MPRYDTALKLVLQKWGSLLFDELAPEGIARWCSTEFPKVSTQYADLLAETASGKLWHLELQSTNDERMPFRMLEYALRVHAAYGRLPRQCVLYVGRDPLRMRPGIRDHDLRFRYRLADIRDLDGERLLTSGGVGDKIMAILTTLRNSREAVQQVLVAIGALAESEREQALQACLLLGGLRQLEEVIEQEARKMPVFDDILENKVLGREFQRGLDQGIEKGIEKGIKKGLQEGKAKGLQEGELKIIRRLIQKRFGPVPAALEIRLQRLSPAELENLAARVVDAATIDDLLD